MSNVPTNLIPTRITGLPEYMGTSTLGYIPYILDGRTYKVQFGQIAAVGAVPSTRVIAAGTGLAGGGDLSENRVISIANGGVGFDQLSATGVVAGSYGSGSAVPVVTVDLKGRITDISTTPLVITGYVPDSRLVSTGAGLLGGGSLASNRTLSVDFSSATPQALGSATAGVSNAAARGDHVHPAVNLSDTNQTQGALPLGRGGTGDALSPVAGAVVYSTGTKFALADPGDPGQVLTSNGAGEPYWRTITGTGTVTSVSVLTANGFSGGVAFADTTPQITLSTTVTGMIKGDGLSLLAATPGVDFVAPSAYISSGLTMATSRILGRTDLGTGAAQEITVGTGLTLASGSLVNSAPDQTVTLTGGTAISIGGSYPSFTITNTAPDQVVSLTASTGMSVSGTYPSFTLTNTAPDRIVSLTAGTGMSVTGTYPSFTITNTAPDQIVSLTGAGTTTVTGTYPNFTITSNDAYTGTVTSVAASGGSTGLTFSGSPITTSGTLTLGGTLAVASGGTGATTAAGARTNLGAAASGANSDITSLSGVTGAISSPTYIQFGNGSATTLAAGRMWYNQTNGSLNFGMGGGNITQQIGEEIFVYGKASAAITEGQVVVKTGAVGASGVITFAPAPLGTTDSQAIIGVATENIPLNGFGRITSFGVVHGINTTGAAYGETWADGDTLYYNPNYVGGLTNVKPSAPNQKTEVGIVINAGSGGSGSIQVEIIHGTVLGGTDSNVQLTSPANNELLQYSSSLGYWRNVSNTSVSVGSATTATNLAGGAGGSIPYQSIAGTTTFLASGTGVLAASGGNPSYTMSPSLTQVTVAADPTTNLQVATKQYVDTLVASGVTYHTPVKYEVPDTTGNLNATYNNGTAGVGATLTNAGTLGAFTPDGTVASVGDRILIYNQTNAAQNGVYTVTTVGNGSTPWVLTRATDANSYALKSPTGLGEGDAFFVTSGATGAGETYVCNTTGTITFGTTPITFVQVSSAPVYTAGTGLTLTGNQFSLTSPVATSLGGTGLTSFTSGGAVYATSTSALTTGTLPLTAGGTGATTAAGARTSLGGTTVGSNFFTLTNPSAITFPQINADNTVSALSAAAFRAAIGAGTGGGSVTSVDVSGGTTGLTTSGGPITSSGTITLAGTLGVANGGTGATSLSSGYVLKGNGTSAVSASVIYDNGTNVGVGTSSPGAKFDVRSGYILAGTASSTEGTKILGGYYSSGSLTTFGSERSNGGPVIGYGVWPSTVAEASFVSATGINVARGAYTMVGNVHKWFAGGAQTVAVDSAVSMSEAMRLDASGNLLNYTSVRAPIFYDYNNTAYYLDAASTSLLGGALFNNVTIDPSSIGAGVGVGTITESSTGFSAPGIAFGGGTGQHGAIVYAGDTMYFGAENGSDNTLGVRATLNNSGSFAATGDVRAPIFYDSNNTAYYLNPESTSVLYEVSTYYIRNKQTGNRALYIDGTTWNQFADPDGATKLWLGGTLDPYNYYNGNVHYFRNNSSGNTMTIDASGIVVATAQMRAPIFYDSDNTAYYLDAAGTSNLGQINFGDSTKFIRGGASGQIILGAGSASDAYIQVGGSYYPIWNSGNFTPGNYMPISGGTFTGAVTFPGGSLVSIDGGIRARFNNGSSGAVYFGSGDNYLYYDGANFTLNGGYVYNASSFRAPVFYDSNDTGYYVDAASNTVLNTLYLRNSGIPVQAKFAQASQFGYSSSYRTVVLGNEYLTTISMGVDVSGNASGSFNGQGEGREVIFRNGVNFITPNAANNGYHQVLQLSDGNGYFGNIAQAAGSLRAPIFYDSDNTGYYVNPAGTSYVLGEFQVQQSGISGLRIISGTGTQSLWVRAGYDTDGTGTPASSPYNIEFQSSGSSGGSFTFVSGNTKALTITSDYAQGAGSLRAPIYYDSDNTSYYWNINGGSGSNIYTYITGLAYYTCQFGNNVYSGAVSSPPLQAFSSDGGTAMMSFHRAGAYAVNFGLDPDNYLRIGGWSAGSNRWVLDMSGNNWVASSFRAPIFYDSDNTGYYVDPASGSRLNGNVSIGAGAYDVARLSIKKDTSGVTPADSASIVLSNRSTAINGTLAGGIFMDTYRDVRDPHYSGGIWFTRNQEVSNLSSSSDIVFGAMISWDSGLPTERMRVYGSGGYVGATNSFRAPVFYDSNDTNYYLDPASTSNLNRLLLQPRIDNYYVGSVSSTDPVSDWQSLTNTTGQFVVSQFNNFGAGGFSNYPSGVYTYGAVLSWRTVNHSFQLYASHTGDLAYKTQWNNDNYSGWLTPVVYGRNAGSSSGKTIYGTVLYDADNTGYYVDPTGSTSLRTVGDWRSDSSAWTGEFNGKIQYHASNWYFQAAGSWEFRRSDSANAFYVSQGGVAIASSDMRAPIFYDNNNTGYYVDAASESVLNTLTLFGELNLSASGINYIDHTGTIYFRNQSGYATSATLTTGGNFTATGNVTAYSDARLKEDVETIGNALDLIGKMRGVTYTRKDTGSKGVGVIAQEMQEVIPQVVEESAEGTLSVAYGNLVGVLIEAVKELTARVAELEGK